MKIRHCPTTFLLVVSFKKAVNWAVSAQTLIWETQARENLAIPWVLRQVRMGNQIPFPQQVLGRSELCMSWCSKSKRNVRQAFWLQSWPWRLKLMGVYLLFVTGSEATFDRWPRLRQCEMLTKRLSEGTQVRLGCGDFGGTQVLQSPGDLAGWCQEIPEGRGRRFPAAALGGDKPPAETGPRAPSPRGCGIRDAGCSLRQAGGMRRPGQPASPERRKIKTEQPNRLCHYYSIRSNVRGLKIAFPSLTSG